MSTSKKVHIGKNGRPQCVSRWSAHVNHKPSIVLPLDEFLRLPKERQCQKCAQAASTKDFARGLSSFLGITPSVKEA